MTLPPYRLALRIVHPAPTLPKMRHRLRRCQMPVASVVNAPVLVQRRCVAGDAPTGADSQDVHIPEFTDHRADGPSL